MGADYHIQQMYWDATDALRNYLIKVVPDTKWETKIGQVPNGNECFFRGLTPPLGKFKRGDQYEVECRLANHGKLIIRIGRNGYVPCFMSFNSVGGGAMHGVDLERMLDFATGQILLGLQQTSIEHGEKPVAIKTIEQQSEFQTLYGEFVRTARQFGIDPGAAGDDCGQVQVLDYIRGEMSKKWSLISKVNGNPKINETEMHVLRAENTDLLQRLEAISKKLTATEDERLQILKELGDCQMAASTAKPTIKSVVDDYTTIARLEGEINAYKSFVDRLLVGK